MFLFSFERYREQLDTWSLLAKARNEGRLFSRIKLPSDPETVSFFEWKTEKEEKKICFCFLEFSDYYLYLYTFMGAHRKTWSSDYTFFLL